MNAHLAKPLQIKKVKQTIAEWVNNNRTGKKTRKASLRPKKLSFFEQPLLETTLSEY